MLLLAVLVTIGPSAFNKFGLVWFKLSCTNHEEPYPLQDTEDKTPGHLIMTLIDRQISQVKQLGEKHPSGGSCSLYSVYLHVCLMYTKTYIAVNTILQNYRGFLQ